MQPLGVAKYYQWTQSKWKGYLILCRSMLVEFGRCLGCFSTSHRPSRCQAFLWFSDHFGLQLELQAPSLRLCSFAQLKCPGGSPGPFHWVVKMNEARSVRPGPAWKGSELAGCSFGPLDAYPFGESHM